MLITIGYFILALLLLVLVHEFGHFSVARLCGVKVLRFSFGFGKVLASWKGKKGTEYAWSLLPLGGYVKMLDEAEGNVPANERHLAFNTQPVWARIAIVVAGPLFNIIFAFVALWLVLILGIHSLAPMIAEVKPGSIAAQAGLQPQQEIISINDKSINSWRDFQYEMMPLIGSDESITLGVKSLKNGQVKTIILPLSSWVLEGKRPNPLESLGITPFIPTIPPLVGEVMLDSPAYKAGIQVNDYIEKMNGKKVGDWVDLVNYVRNHPNQLLTLSLLREGKVKTITVTISGKLNKDKMEGFLGLRSQKIDWPAKWLRFQREDPITALKTALIQTGELTTATFSLMGRFVTGKLALQNISGPVGIAQGAGESGRSGIASYLFFLAIVSISLGTLNLLPIPMLDGGYLLFYLIEFILGRPLSESSKSIGFYLGMAFLVAIMVLAFSNDISRLSS